MAVILKAAAALVVVAIIGLIIIGHKLFRRDRPDEETMMRAYYE